MKNQNEYAAVSDVTARMREEASILSLLNGQRIGVFAGWHLVGEAWLVRDGKGGAQ